MVNENTSDSKLVEIVKRFTGRSTIARKLVGTKVIGMRVISLLTPVHINYWRFSKDYEECFPETNIYKEEISKRINLKPGGILYLVFPSFVSGFGKLFDDRYQTMHM